MELALRVERVDGIDTEGQEVLEAEVVVEAADAAPDDVALLVLEAGGTVETEVLAPPPVKTK
jgi:hypothetical protein